MSGDVAVSSGSGPDPRIEALKSFKDWSNYLLVTTVAAIGWIARTETAPSLIPALAIWSLGISAVFGIFSLALVPLISEQMEQAVDRTSIFAVPVRFYAGGSTLRTMYLTQACRPQHLSFILGILLYCVAATGYRMPTPGSPVRTWCLAVAPPLLVVIFIAIAVRSHRRSG
jgi:hypothetical protein